MNIKVISWNVNGIRSVHIKNFIQHIEDLKPDILALQEVKCNDHEIIKNIFKETGYSFEFRPAQKKGYSGVLTAYHERINSTASFPAITDLKNENVLHETFFNEGRCLLLKIKKFYLLNLYVPSGSSSEERQQIKYRLMENLTFWVKGLQSEIRENLVICGDMNICHMDLDIHHPKQADRLKLSGFLPEERQWFSNFLGLKLFDVYREFYPNERQYTWWSYRAGARGKNLGWRLDYFLSGENIFKSIKDVKQHVEIHGSDHCPIEIQVEVN